MKKSILYFFGIYLVLVSFFSSSALGQSQTIDSLKRVIKNAPADSTKVNTYIALNKELFSEGKREEMIDVSNQGIRLSKRIAYPYGVGQLILQKGIAYQVIGEPKKAIDLYQEGIEVAKINDLKELESKFYINIGNYYYRLGDLDIALGYFLTAYEIKEVLDKRSLGRLLNNIAIIYRLQKKYDKAELLYLESLKLKEAVNDSIGIATSYLNLGRLNSLREGKRQIGIQQLTKSLQIHKHLNNPYDIAICQVALGQVYYESQRYEDAKTALQNAWNFFKINSNKEYAIKTLGILGAIASEQKEYEIAEEYYTESLQLIGDDEGRKQDKVEILQELSTVKSKLKKNNEAYDFLAASYVLYQELNENERHTAMEEMQAKFEVAQKEQLITEQKLAITRNIGDRNLLIVVIFSLLLLSLGLIIFYKNRLKYKERITQQNKELQKQEIVKLQQENRMTAMDSMLEGQEKERARIAQDLHDSLGGLLSSVKSYFQSTQIKDAGTAQRVEKTTSLIDEVASEVRRISHNMMPQALVISGVEDALNDIAIALKVEKYDVSFECKDLPQLKANQEIMLYRLVQELINNIKKHAEANSIFIQLYAVNKKVFVTVEDDGKGFDIQAKNKENGLGLKSINSRVAYLNGEILWHSEMGKGTTVDISFAA